MNKRALVFLACLLAVGGCARHYVIRLNNGQFVTTASKPKLKGAAYHFKDARGREQIIPEGRVHEIEPASMAKEELAPMPTRRPQPKKPKHWYLLWLG